MRALDRRAALDFGISPQALMENAGRAVAEETLRLGPGPVTVFCGTGNNGGDGLVASRWLAKAGRRVRVVLALPPNRFKPQASALWPGIPRMGLGWTVYSGSEKLLRFTRGSRCFVDALLGTGLRAPVEDPTRAMIGWLNASGRRILSVDVPSGFDADRGLPVGEAVRATVTVTLAHPKRGLLLPGARAYVGRLVVGDIGFPLFL
jgi:NAD(P)H-hydrate epimerase